MTSPPEKDESAGRSYAESLPLPPPDDAIIGQRSDVKRFWVNPEVKSGRNSQSVPAKRSERIRGSQQNVARSAASRSSARDITLTPQLVAALKRKVEEHNNSLGDDAPSSKRASLPMLKAVLRRGMGAFSVSHRPNVSSRQQWGMARVNAFLRILRTGSPEDSKYVSDNDLLPDGHPRASRSQKSLRDSDSIAVFNLDVKAATRSGSRYLRRVAYNPQAKDGDGDGIVQEGTPWERPAGARFLDLDGNEIEQGRLGTMFHSSLRLVDADGNQLQYRQIAKPVAGSRRSRRFYAIGDNGRTIGEVNAIRGLDISDAPAPSRARGDNPKFRISVPQHLTDRFTTETANRAKTLFNVGRRGGGGKSAVRGAGMSTEKAAQRALRILEAASARDIQLGKGWYARQRATIAELARQTDQTQEIATGVVAALSPKMAWDRNAAGGRFVTPNLDVAAALLSNWRRYMSTEVEIDAKARKRFKLPKDLANGTYKLRDLDLEDAAKILPSLIQEDIDYAIPLMNKPLLNAMRIILKDGDIDANLRGPKVRAFYDNLLNPDTSEAVTVDSIMAQLVGRMNSKAAEKWLKLKGLGREGQLFDRNGKKVADAGVYYAIADVIYQTTARYNQRRPASEHLSVHDVQAILWYIQREKTARFASLRRAEKALASQTKKLQQSINAQKPNNRVIAERRAAVSAAQRELNDQRTLTRVYDEF